MLFKCLKRMIEKGNYESKEAMGEKISPEQYMELMELFYEGGEE